MLSELGREQGSVEIILLSFHVDYWNYIGWKDAFSSSQWSKRQRRYAAALPSNRTYTPQLVVQGEIDCVGSNERCVRNAVERVHSRPSAGVVTIDQARAVGGSVVIDAGAALNAGQPGAVAIVVIFESGLSTDVRRGENKGRQLRNDFVVRALKEVGTIQAGDTTARRVTTRIPIGDEWQSENLGAVVFLQDPSSRRVLVAARAPIRR